jgi:hypothetical protein
MHRQIRRVGLVLLIAFVAIFAQLNYVQIFAAQDIAGHDANIRRLLAEYSIKRGDIVTLDGVTVATSRATEGRLRYRRLYPGEELYGHITGYYSLVYGTDRIERTFNDQLLGERTVITMQDVQDRLFGEGRRGDDVRLTIPSDLQETARAALGDQQGAVVAIDPTTGEVRAMWGNPSFDPGPLAAHDTEAAEALAAGLRRNGLRVKHARTGAEAVDTNWRVDLVLLDLNLPGTDGFEQARVCRPTQELDGFVQDLDRAGPDPGGRPPGPPGGPPPPTPAPPEQRPHNTTSTRSRIPRSLKSRNNADTSWSIFGK